MTFSLRIRVLLAALATVLLGVAAALLPPTLDDVAAQRDAERQAERDSDPPSLDQRTAPQPG